MILLINPPLVSHQGDSHSSGIPYLPHGLAYLSTELDRREIQHEVLDAFGENPRSSRAVSGQYLLLGLSEAEVTARAKALPLEAAVIYASSVFNSVGLSLMAKAVRAAHPNIPIILTENTQAVTGYSVLKIGRELKRTEITLTVLGEAEAVLPEALPYLLAGKELPGRLAPHFWRPDESPDGKRNAVVENLDALGLPNWGRFPLPNYWKLRVAHGPVSNPYVAMLTSRGCPYPCAFCSVPVMNNQKWRMRSAESVVDEMSWMQRRFGVSEFHWEDLNPTIHEPRMREIARLIIERGLSVKWRLVSGTKLDNLKIETLELLADAGLDYVSFSPESGSLAVLKRIKKPFRHAHAVQQVKVLRRRNVETQACFVLGFPGETNQDRTETARYARKLIRAGLGEVTYFIVAPMPGTPIETQVPGEYTSLSELTFSPQWRTDFKSLVRWRNRLYLEFFALKALVSPKLCAKTLWNAFTGTFSLKMEMFPRRRAWVWLSTRRAQARQAKELLAGQSQSDRDVRITAPR